MTALREFLLGFADDEHLMGQQHTEWIGVAPFLEEDLALSSIGQDELGHAVLLYELVLDLDGIKRSGEPASDAEIDELAYGRGPDAYRSCAFVEVPLVDWADTLVRHWVYDAAEQLRWDNVANSANQALADVATRAEREEVFHRLHADALLDVLLTDEASRTRLLAALHTLAPTIGTVLTPVADEAELVNGGVIARTTDALALDLTERIEARFGVRPALTVPGDGRAARSEHFGPLMARMREVFDLDPSASW